uniref:Tyrosine protein kinase:Serine/threonine protein kinase n=1 Tax=Nonomuraea gerenzanensis TaxID=93944 RepID=A0A1M4EBT9_9ACTN|nr:Tyrosine protein kinase:Serine/threonine protein kinase [Nonomuraea gerenzanensis]
MAVKLLRPDRDVDARTRARFAKEVAATRKVAPFCTARVIAAEPDAPQPYLVSEYVDGPSLQRAVTELGPFGPIELHSLATGVATALTAIHRAGVVHRDLKPANVVLGPDGPRVIDFGIAKFEGSTLTDAGVVPIGTPAYLSPERVRGEPAGRPADVWAWGAVVLFAASGAPPFAAETAAATYQLILTRQPDLFPLDGTLLRLVAAAMSADPRERPRAQDLLEVLTGGAGDLLVAGSQAARAARRPADLPATPGERTLGDLAEEAYRRYDPQDQALLPGLFLRLVLPGGTPETMLRRARLTDLLDGSVAPERAGHVLAGLVRGGLVRNEGGDVALASAALIPAWPRLREWIDEEGEGLGLHARLSGAAQRWQASGRDPAELYRGAELRAALDRPSGSSDRLVLNQLERAFLDASATYLRAQDRRRRQVTAVVFVLAATVLATASILVAQTRSEGANQLRSSARRTAETAQRLRASEPIKAMLLSVAAWRLAPGDPRVYAQLRSSLAQRELDVFRPPTKPGDARHALGANGKTLAVVNAGTATLYDLATHRALHVVGGVGDEVRSIALRPDGRVLAVSGDRDITLWNLASGRRIGRAFGSGAEQLAFDAGGDVLIARTAGDAWQTWSLTRAGTPSLIRRVTQATELQVARDARTSVEVSPTRRYLLRDRRGSSPAPGGLDQATGLTAAFSPDGKVMAVGDGLDARLWNVARARWSRVVLHGANPLTMSFNADGRYLATWDGTAVSVWSRTGTRVLNHPLPALTGEPRFGPGDRTLVCLLSDGTAVVLDLAGLTRSDATMTPGAAAAAFDGRAERVAVQGARATELFRTRTRAAELRLSRAGVPGAVLAFSSDGVYLAMTTPDQPEVAIWNTARRRLERTLTIDAPQVAGLAFRPGGTTLAIAPLGESWGDLQLWDAKRGVHLETIAHPGGDGMAFDSAGTALVVNGGDNSGVIGLSPRRLRPRPFGPDSDGVLGVAYSPGNAMIATGRTAHGVDLWNATDLSLIRRLAATDAIFDQFQVLAFSPDGRTLAAGGFAGRIWLWNVSDGALLGEPVPQHAGHILALAFTPDGGTLYSLGEDGALRTHPITASGLATEVCARARASLSPGEWSRYIEDQPPRRVC